MDILDSLPTVSEPDDTQSRPSDNSNESNRNDNGDEPLDMPAAEYMSPYVPDLSGSRRDRARAVARSNTPKKGGGRAIALDHAMDLFGKLPYPNSTYPNRFFPGLFLARCIQQARRNFLSYASAAIRDVCQVR